MGKQRLGVILDLGSQRDVEPNNLVRIRGNGSSEICFWMAWQKSRVACYSRFFLVMFTFVGVSLFLGGHHSFVDLCRETVPA